MTFKTIFFLFWALTCSAQIIIPNDSTQLLVVSSKDFNTSIAHLQAYEKIDKTWQKRFQRIQVNLGRKGLAWGKGLISFNHKEYEPVKKEGDGKAPAGLFSLDGFFGYEKQDFNFKYLQVNNADLCIDDSHSKHYNTLLKSTHPEHFKSFEYMKRQDRLYALGIFVGHNQQQTKQAGSCIFIHIQRGENSPTAGCTSMKEETLFKLMKWLEESKHPVLLQLPQSYLKTGFK
jgi:L,D-peptidoglycan transpeptidase YkuD (ErfK/YbiS/YcfS/YnhG family)